MEGRSNSENSVYKTTFPTRDYFNIGTQQNTQLQESFKKASSDLKKDWTAAISRRASQYPTHQDGQPVRIRRSNLLETTKGSNNVAWHPNIMTPNEARGLPCRQLTPILRGLPNYQPPPQYCPARTPWADCQPSRRPLLQQTGRCCPLPGFHTRRCTAHSRSRRRPKQTSETRRSYSNISLQNYYATTVQHWPNKYHMCLTVIVN